MRAAAELVEVWRGPILESRHWGHALICDAQGKIVQAWGNPDEVILPRSSAKMIQAQPLVESGAADAFGLTEDRLAFACASHQAAPVHTAMVRTWLGELGLGEEDLRCGPEMPRDTAARLEIECAGGTACRVHNNCSGKHSGFLTLAKHLGAGPEYLEIDHPVQRAVREAFEDVTGEDSPGFGIDGCSAPNFATTMHGMARAMGFFAGARIDGSSARERAAARLRDAMRAHPLLVAGEGRACTELMRAMDGRVTLKTGAEGYFIAILPEQKLGIAVKAADGATRAAECIVAALLVRLGALDPDHPATLKCMNVPVLNRAGQLTGHIKPSATLLD